MKIIKDELLWYKELAESAARHMESKNAVAMTAVFTELSLDGGRRASRAIAELEKIDVNRLKQLLAEHLGYNYASELNTTDAYAVEQTLKNVKE